MGNPYYDNSKGGGTGCHLYVDGGKSSINQIDAIDPNGLNLVKNYDCECDTSFVEAPGCNQFAYSGYQGGDTNCWDEWIKHWIAWDKTNTFPVDIKMRDVAACWMHSMRDMINLQNWFWLNRRDWTTDTGKYDYWGWNEIPIQASYTNDPLNYKTLAIILPVDAWDLSSMNKQYKIAVMKALAWYERKKYLKPGKRFRSKRPGSYITLLRQKEDANGNFDFEFFCESVVLGQKYVIVYEPENGGTGSCYVKKR